MRREELTQPASKAGRTDLSTSSQGKKKRTKLRGAGPPELPTVRRRGRPSFQLRTATDFGQRTRGEERIHHKEAPRKVAALNRDKGSP